MEQQQRDGILRVLLCMLESSNLLVCLSLDPSSMYDVGISAGTYLTATLDFII